jgi:hypothetical protein
MGAADDLAQRRLASAVLADQAVDRAALDAEVDVFESLYAPEALADVAYFDVGLSDVQPLSPTFLSRLLTTGV